MNSTHFHQILRVLSVTGLDTLKQTTFYYVMQCFGSIEFPNSPKTGFQHTDRDELSIKTAFVMENNR